MVDGWNWFYGDGEVYHGPCLSRLDAIDSGRDHYGEDMGFVICEAQQKMPDLGKFVNIDWLLENLDEAVSEEHANPDVGSVLEDLDKSQERAFERMVRNTVSDWQKIWCGKLKPWLFTAQRNEETIQPLPEEV